MLERGIRVNTRRPLSKVQGRMVYRGEGKCTNLLGPGDIYADF